MRGVIDSGDELLLAPLSMGEAVVQDAVGKCLPTSKVATALTLWREGRISPSSIEMCREFAYAQRVIA
ncbi:hypothetical protein [Schaalia sp. 19OD2882]|uniref:hypothetical protein n=1 Tax=Schaalia sp. 19OD2882 TaxID=2794089 RepID=UPI001C1E8F06|nr:hypothetical protein [Schaalia sp. 19OD2882]